MFRARSAGVDQVFGSIFPCRCPFFSQDGMPDNDTLPQG